MNKSLESDAAVRLFCSFRTEGRLYGIDATQVREISTQVDCTPVPQAPTAVRGLANLRSRIFLVVDIRPILGFPPVPCTADSRLIVLKPQLTEDMGILVEHGGDIVHVHAGQIEGSIEPTDDESSASESRQLAVTVGVCKLGNELMTMIDASRLIQIVKVLMQ